MCERYVKDVIRFSFYSFHFSPEGLKGYYERPEQEFSHVYKVFQILSNPAD